MDFKHLRSTFGLSSSQQSANNSKSTATSNPPTHKQQWSIRTPVQVMNSGSSSDHKSPMARQSVTPPMLNPIQLVSIGGGSGGKPPLTTQLSNAKGSGIIGQNQVLSSQHRQSIPQSQLLTLTQSPQKSSDLPRPDQSTTKVKELERQIHLMKQENEDLRVSLKINKESLQCLIEEKMPQQSALIRTIDVISSENAKLSMNLDRLRAENEQLKSAIVQTGRSMAVNNNRDFKKQKEYSDKESNTSFELQESPKQQLCLKCSSVSTASSGQNQEERKKSPNKHAIKPKGMSRVLESTNGAWEREEAFRENERTIKKLIVEVSRLKTFMKDLQENYSLPENLCEEIKEMIYEQEMTHYDNNNEFFAQLPPLSPISTSHLTATITDHSLQMAVNSHNPYRAAKNLNAPRQQRHFHIPKLDLSKIKPEENMLDEFYAPHPALYIPEETVPQNNRDYNHLLSSGLLNQSSLQVNDDDSNLLDDIENQQLMDDNLLMLSSVREDTSKQIQVLSRQHRRELMDLEGDDIGHMAGLDSELGGGMDNEVYVDEGGNFIYGTQDLSEQPPQQDDFYNNQPMDSRRGEDYGERVHTDGGHDNYFDNDQESMGSGI